MDLIANDFLESKTYVHIYKEKNKQKVGYKSQIKMACNVILLHMLLVCKLYNKTLVTVIHTRSGGQFLHMPNVLPYSVSEYCNVMVI